MLLCVRHERGVSLADDLSIDVIEPECVEVVKEIVDRMIRAGYEKECCQVYSSVRRDVLDEYMSVLGAERLSIEEVQRIEWNLLDEKMKKWVQAIKIMTRVLLPGAKSMDNIVDALNTAYQEFVAAASGALEAKEVSGGQDTAATDAALENFKQRWELFRVACDRAEEFVESVKQRIGSECLVDELQQGSGTAGSASLSHPSAPFDARFHEDAGQ